jgi:ATP/maltotriose-dependent transcriptional regulator MalT
VPPDLGDRARPDDAVFHPLFTGARRLLEGHAAAAILPLREAVAQQRSGEGLLRSEAVALLVVSLAATGQLEDARELLAESPPDRVAVFAGLRPWAESAVEAAAGQPKAVALAFAAYEQARVAGSPLSAVAYLATAARYGASARASAELLEWNPQLESPVSLARAAGVRARSAGDAAMLLGAAEQHAAIGLLGDAADLADLALAAGGRTQSATSGRAKVLGAEMRRRLRQTDTAPSPVIPLTRRELEVATLAGKGMSDQDIAATLVISVRTVESHLAATYRKLGINSRRGLRQVL